MLLDPDKLMRLRELLDVEVSGRAVEHEISRRAALRSIASDLGHDLECFKVEGWFVVSARSHRHGAALEWYSQQVEKWNEAAELDIASRSCKWAVAASLEIAMMGSLCLLLDPAADLQMEPCRLEEYVPVDARPDEDAITYALAEYIRQERWFGDVPQYGAAADIFNIEEVYS